MRNRQIKVSLRSHDVELLEWVAGRLGEPTATYAARIIGEKLSALLVDADVRMLWRLHQKAAAGAALSVGEDLADKQAGAILRGLERVGEMAR